MSSLDFYLYLKAISKEQFKITALLIYNYMNNGNQASLVFSFLHTATSNSHGKKDYQHLNQK